MPKPKINKIKLNYTVYKKNNDDTLRYTNVREYRKRIMGSEKQQEEMRALTEENKRKKQRSIQPSNAASSSEQRVVMDNSDYGVGDNYQHQSKTDRFNELWEIQGSLIQEWFMEAFSYGNPNPKLAEPHAIESTGCNCDNKQISKVYVYMLHNGNLDNTYF